MTKHRMKEIDDAVRQIMLQAVDLDWGITELAWHSDVSNQTVYNLVKGITIYPRFSTVVKLAKAVGLQITFQKQKQHRHIHRKVA